MKTYDRRGFLQITTGAATAVVGEQLFASVPADAPKRAFRLGLLASIKDDPDSVIAHVQSLGLPTAHVSMREFSNAMAPRLRSALDRYGVEATVFISSGPGEETNPVDALDVVGKYVQAVHAKGGFYPTDPRYLGKQVPAYEPNKVDWPLLIRRLKELDYDGTVTIEAVTRGPERNHDIQSDKAYLERLIAQS
jgi:hypothetical protein